MCWVVPSLLFCETVAGFAVVLLEEAEPTASVAEIGLDSFECCRNGCRLKICYRPCKIDIDAEIDISRANVRSSVGFQKPLVTCR